MITTKNLMTLTSQLIRCLISHGTCSLPQSSYDESRKGFWWTDIGYHLHNSLVHYLAQKDIRLSTFVK